MLSALLFLGIIFIYIPFMFIKECVKGWPDTNNPEANRRRSAQVRKEDKLDNDFGVIETDWDK